MKKRLSILTASAFVLGLAACGTDDNAGDNDKQKVQTNQVKINNTDNGSKRLSLSDRAERQVEQMNEVDDANVIISNNNAYVAVKLRDGGNGNNENNGNGNRDGGNNEANGNGGANNGEAFGGGAGTGGTGGTGTGGAGTGGSGTGDKAGTAGNGIPGDNDGRVNQNNGKGSDGLIDGNGDAGNGNNKDNAKINKNGDDKNGEHYSKVSTKFEQRIADQVRQADDRIHRVYVSFDKNFYNTMGNYANDIRDNNNREGLFEDFNNTIDDVFRRDSK